MTEDEVYSFLKETFLEVFKRDIRPTPEMSAKDVPGWDSFAQISIIVATEDRFDITFTTPELDGLKNVGDYVRTVMSKVTG